MAISGDRLSDRPRGRALCRPQWGWLAVALSLGAVACDESTDARPLDSSMDAAPMDAQAPLADLGGDAADVAPPDQAVPDQGPPCGGDCGVGARCVEERCAPLPVPPPVEGAAAVDTTLCFSEHAIPYGESDESLARQAVSFEVLARMGVRTLRQQFQWHRIERSQGEFDWRMADGRIGVAAAHGIETMALLGYGNPWASTLGAEHDDPYYPADDPADFAAFTGAFAARFGDRVRRYEIWNEQNAGYRFWKNPIGPSGQPDLYGEHLTASHAAIHAQRADAIVGFGGMFYVPQGIIGAEDFLAEAYRADPDLGAAFEALAWHPYAFYPPLDRPERDEPRGIVDLYAVDQTADRLVQIMVEHEGESARAKPRWITELGWPSERGIDEATQAQYLARGWLLSLAGGVDTYCVYRLQDPSPDIPLLTPWEGTFGVIYADDDPLDDQPPVEKPAVRALGDLNAGLAGLRYATRRDPDPRLPETVRWLVFSDADGQTADVIWSFGEPVELTVPLRGPATVRRIGTDPVAAPEGDAVGLVVDGTPQIVRQPAPEALGE